MSDYSKYGKFQNWKEGHILTQDDVIAVQRLLRSHLGGGTPRRAFWSGVASLVVLVAAAGWLVVFFLNSDPIPFRLIVQNIPAIIGLPLAAIGAFAMIVMLRQTSTGDLAFEGFGFKFKVRPGRWCFGFCAFW